MSARGLHVLTGAQFEHAHPECPTCRHRTDGGRPGFIGYCQVKQKTLCCEKPRRCRAYEARSEST